jgi:hypothetical protein
MTNLVSTGLAGLVAEAKDVEAKLEAMVAAPTPVLAVPPTPILVPIPDTPPVTPPPVPPPTVTAPTTPPPVTTAAPSPASATIPAMVISDEPIPVPADAVPIPAVAPAAPIQSPQLAALAKEEARVADLEAQKQAFYQRVRDAKQAGLPKALVPQPIPERILAQTQAEMAAGAAAVAAHAEAQGRRIIPVQVARPGIVEPTTSPVFRPDNYVPDQKKGQGNVTSTPLT